MLDGLVAGHHNLEAKGQLAFLGKWHLRSDLNMAFFSLYLQTHRPSSTTLPILRQASLGF